MNQALLERVVCESNSQPAAEAAMTEPVKRMKRGLLGDCPPHGPAEDRTSVATA